MDWERQTMIALDDPVKRSQLAQVSAQWGIIVSTPKGAMRLLTTRADQLLSQYFLPYRSRTLPAGLCHWLRQQILEADGTTHNKDNSKENQLPYFQTEKEGHLLTVYVMGCLNDKQYVLLLSERKLPSLSITDLESLGLTKREAEVLFWVVKDKSNSEVAKALDCRPGTIRKHLENIYKKLDVQSRIGAMMVVLEKLGILKS